MACTDGAKLSESSSNQLIASHCRNVNSNVSWTLVVHVQQVNKTTCTPLCSFPSVLQDEFATFDLLNHIEVCPGQPDKHFVELLQKTKGVH